MTKRIVAVVLILLIAVSSLAGCGIKVVKIGEEGKLTGATAFNADDDVAGMWESKAVPELNEKAVDLKTFLTDAKGDLKSLDKKYGKYSMGSSGELSYVVKGTAKVTKVDQEKKAGFMEVALEGYSGKEVVKLQIGTVFKGSAVRDSLDFIKYEDFKNQVQWAAVSQSIHTIILNEVIKPLNVSSLTGKTVEFVGCFTVDDNSELLITPVQMTVK